MQLVEKGKISLTDTLSSILGFEIRNPYHPNRQITL
jgi:CubicO group peptidase (beta-lactamase class C family)